MWGHFLKVLNLRNTNHELYAAIKLFEINFFWQRDEYDPGVHKDLDYECEYGIVVHEDLDYESEYEMVVHRVLEYESKYGILVQGDLKYKGDRDNLGRRYYTNKDKYLVLWEVLFK